MEGFKYEKQLTLLSVGLGVVSTLLLIRVLTLQHEYFSYLNDRKDEEIARKNGNT